MRTLARAVANRDAIGKPLKLPWRELNRHVKVHTKELVIVGGAPGGGKSTLSVNIAMKVDYPVLYFAQDSPFSVVSRMTALARSIETEEARRLLADPDSRERVSRELAEVRPTLLVHGGAVTTEKIERSLDALSEWLGEPPPLVIVDNLIDMLTDGYRPSDNGFYATILPELKQMAIRWDTCMMVLHHVIRSHNWKQGEASQSSGRAPMKMDDLLFAGEREARHVWGVYNDGHSTVHTQVLKQQDGPADARGNMEIDLQWFPRYGNLVP